MEYKLKRLGRKLIRAGSALDFYEDEMLLPSGKTENWEFVHHRRGGGACVVPVLPDGRILLIRQYRPCVDAESLELPAGAREDPSEDGTCTARRELEEETGFICSDLKFLAKIQTAMSWCDESTEIYLARDIEKSGRMHPDDAEEITAECYPLEELLRMIADGRLQDAKTVAGILAYAAIK